MSNYDINAIESLSFKEGVQKRIQEEDERKWCVYSHALEDGRCYIGQTCDIKSRWKPSAYKNCCKFYNAIEKYGWDSFKHIILFDNLTLKEANYFEEKMILLYDSMNNGFNLNTGGDNRIASQETRDKMSKIRKGVPHSKEHREAISRALKEKKKTPEAIRNNQLAQHRKMVECIETGQQFESIADAARKMNINYNGISRCCRKMQITAGGYHWKFIEE